MKKNDVLKMNDASSIIFINSITDAVVCYSNVTTNKNNTLKTVLNTVRYSSIENINTYYDIIGNYPKELIND